jgi:hypothetical protein
LRVSEEHAHEDRPAPGAGRGAGVRVKCCAGSRKACRKGRASIFHLASERRNDQERLLVSFRSAQHGRHPRGRDFQNSGHHHLLIDVNEPLDVNEPIPQDKNHLHFGAGQTEARIELQPGKHTLQLVLGDAKHYPFNPPLVSEKITITVK